MNFSFFKNQKGAGLIGLLVGIVVIAAIAYGSLFFWKNSTKKVNIDSEPTNPVSVLDQAKKDIEEINEKTESKQEEIKEEAVEKEELDEKVEEIVEIVEEIVEIVEEDEEKTEVGNDAIKIFNIKAGDPVSSPLRIEGEAVAFENNLIVELRDQDHKTKVKEFTTIKSNEVGVPGPYKITLNFEFSNTKEGYVAVYEESAKDGSEQNLVEIPVKFGIDANDWTTYRNEEYGFELRYPNELLEKENSFWTKENYDYKYISKSTDGLVYPEFKFIIYGLDNSGIDSIISKNLLVSKEYYENNKEEIKQIENISNNNFIKVQNIDNRGCSYYVKKDDNVLISFLTPDNCSKDIVLKQILETFKFIN